MQRLTLPELNPETLAALSGQKAPGGPLDNQCTDFQCPVWTEPTFCSECVGCVCKPIVTTQVR